MAKKRKKEPGACVYCGRLALLTEDHIPPKTLFPEAMHCRLLIIPSCSCCNNGASKDDEYLRNIIGLSAKGERDEALGPISDATVRCLVRPEAAGFRAWIVNGLEEKLVLGPDGVLKLATFGQVELTRIDRVIARIIKGIFYKEQCRPLPSNYRVVNYATEGFKEVPVAEGRKLQAFLEPLIDRDPREIGASTHFLYWSDYNPEDPNISAWVLLIHRHHSFIGWTVKADDVKVRNAAEKADHERGNGEGTG